MMLERFYVFYSQPFHGRSEMDIFIERATVRDYLESVLNVPVVLIDQYHQEAPEGAPETYYLSQDILMLGKADLVVFAKEWNTSSGCRIEMEVCKKFDRRFMVLENSFR